MAIEAKVNFNYPTSPSKASNNLTFPTDLRAGDRKFYMSLSFAKYNYAQQTSGRTVTSISLGDNINVPIPRKLNDTQTLSWQDAPGPFNPVAVAGALGNMVKNRLGVNASLGGLGGDSLVNYGEAVSGNAVNPNLFMFFQRPNYKEFTLSWSFAPESESESLRLINIIKTIKYHSLPRSNGLFLEYPDILYIKMYPTETFTFSFRPCVITAVQVDYTGAGGPAFFKNGAPTVVNLSIGLKEIQLADKVSEEGGVAKGPAEQGIDIVTGAASGAASAFENISNAIGNI